MKEAADSCATTENVVSGSSAAALKNLRVLGRAKGATKTVLARVILAGGYPPRGSGFPPELPGVRNPRGTVR